MEPDPHHARLNQQQRAEQEAIRQTNAGVEFANAEEMLRHDRARTSPPDAIETRLKHSIAQEPPQPRPWWKRWLGK